MSSTTINIFFETSALSVLKTPRRGHSLPFVVYQCMNGTLDHGLEITDFLLFSVIEAPFFWIDAKLHGIKASLQALEFGVI